MEGRQRYVRIEAATELDLTHQSGFQRRGVTFRAAGSAFPSRTISSIADRVSGVAIAVSCCVLVVMAPGPE